MQTLPRVAFLICLILAFGRGAAAVADPTFSPFPTCAAMNPYPGTALTPCVMSGLLVLVASDGEDQDFPPSISQRLGLVPTPQNWPLRKVCSKSHDSRIHCFEISRGSNQDVLVTVGPLGTKPSDDAYTRNIFRARRDGSVESELIISTAPGRTWTVHDADQAMQSELDQEWLFWGNIFAPNPSPSPS